MAGLPGKSATVRIGPLLSASAPRPGLLTPTWLLLTPLTRPPLPPVPIRLNELEESTVPAMSLAVVLEAGPWKLAATIVLCKVTGRPLKRPAPKTPLEPTVTLLPVMVSLIRLADPLPGSAWMAPPSETAELLTNVQLVTTNMVSELSRPPPTEAAELPTKVLARTISVRSLRMAPPSESPELLIKLVALIVRLPSL